MMTGKQFCRSFLLRVAVVLLLSAAASTASAQVVPAISALGNLSAFGTITAVKPDVGYYSNAPVYGVTLGGFLQPRHFPGLETRGLLLRSGGPQHTEAALIGPRFTRHFGSVSPYVSVLGGLANAWRWSNPPNPDLPPPRMLGGFGPQIQVVGGVDIRLDHHWVFRVGEVGYGKTFTGNAWNLTPLTFGSGIVLRLN
jgi:hypothetical protein